MTTLIVLKIFCLFIGVLFGFINAVNWQRGQSISFISAAIMTFGMVGFTVIQWRLWE